MMKSRSLEAFDLSKETDQTRARYGDTPLGRGVLTARRLIKQKVRFVEVCSGGWDHHGFGADNGVFKDLPMRSGWLDAALSSLLEDLHDRGLLERTLVLCTGEFGRSPKLAESNGTGRGHFGRVWSCFLAGGGIKSGYLHGASDENAAEVKDRPVSPADLHAAMFRVLGIDHNKENDAPGGRPISLADAGMPVAELIA